MEPRKLFAFCPRCGREAVREHSSKSIECVGCGFVLFFNPAAAVGALIPDEQGRILLLRRAKEPARAKLAAPGGFVDPGESLEAALVREVKEEVNLDVEELRFLCSHPNVYVYRGVSYSTCDSFFVGKAKTLGTLMAKEEVDGVVWMRPEEVEEGEVAFGSLVAAMNEYRRHKAGMTRTG